MVSALSHGISKVGFIWVTWAVPFLEQPCIMFIFFMSIFGRSMRSTALTLSLSWRRYRIDTLSYRPVWLIKCLVLWRKQRVSGWSRKTRGECHWTRVSLGHLSCWWFWGWLMMVMLGEWWMIMNMAKMNMMIVMMMMMVVVVVEQAQFVNYSKWNIYWVFTIMWSLTHIATNMRTSSLLLNANRAGSTGKRTQLGVQGMVRGDSSIFQIVRLPVGPTQSAFSDIV